MVTKKLRQTDKQFYGALGQRIGKLILKDRGFSSLDAFVLEHHDKIGKATLYQAVEGKRDLKVSTLRRLADALDLSLEELIAGL